MHLTVITSLNACILNWHRTVLGFQDQGKKAMSPKMESQLVEDIFGNVYQKGSFNGLICAFVKHARFFYLVYCGSSRPPPCSLLKYRINMFKISNALYTAEEFMFNMKITFKCFWTINFYICSDLFLWMKSEHLLKAMSGNKIHNSKVLFSLFLVKASK